MNKFEIVTNFAFWLAATAYLIAKTVEAVQNIIFTSRINANVKNCCGEE